jgi:hypothetical protein
VGEHSLGVIHAGRKPSSLGVRKRRNAIRVQLLVLSDLWEQFQLTAALLEESGKRGGTRSRRARRRHITALLLPPPSPVSRASGGGALICAAGGGDSGCASGERLVTAHRHLRDERGG